MRVVEEFLMDNQPNHFHKDDTANMLEEALRKGASDIHIEGNKPIVVDVHGKLYPLTSRALVGKEVENIIKKLSDDNALSEIYQLRALDTSYTLRTKDERNKTIRNRFRVNAVGTMVGSEKSVQITIRTIPSDPPTKDELGLEDEIWDNFVKDQGIVIVTGPTGSGKSTLLASCIRGILETPDMNKKIITYEAPVEFVYDKIITDSCTVSQTEIGSNLGSWNAAIESAMRRKPDIILIGEARDPETIGNSVLAAQTGHLVATTAHTNNASETLRRMINVFPQEERSSRQVDLIEATNMIVAQRLVPSTDGKRTPIKEFLVFDEEVKDALIECEPNKVAKKTREIVMDRKVSLAHYAEKVHARGMISDEVLRTFQKTYGKA